MRFHSKAVGAVSAAAVAALCLSTSPAAAYTSGQYDLSVDSLQIFDIATTVDPEQLCAEIFGEVTVSRGTQTITFFKADSAHYTEVCEPNRPINEGTQSGLLHASSDAAKEISAKFTGDRNKDLPFVFKIDLWDADTVNDQHLVHNQTVKVWPADQGVRPSSVFFQDGRRFTGVPNDGRQQVRVNYDINIHKEIYRPSKCEQLSRAQDQAKKTLSAAKAEKARLEAKSTRTANEENQITLAARLIPYLEKTIVERNRELDQEHCDSATGGKGH
ncbi:hypothetical protein [Streptomyces sp. NPDC093589]|uniref:hypothetical protein n=1 Tax=Streptomyces sp. NPDC093589 TaxID=3366043 RepID=UPI0037F41F76